MAPALLLHPSPTMVENSMSLQELSASKTLLLAEELWDNVASSDKLFPLTEDQKALLDKRLSNYSIDEDAGDSWENVRNRIHNQ